MPLSPRHTAPSPRKTPRQSRSAETVRAIVEAAARILETEGHAGYNTNAVARLAGVSPGSLYQYFPNKEALTKALIVRETSALLTELRSASEAVTGLLALDAFIAAAVRHQMRRPSLARLLDFEEAMMPSDPDLESVSHEAHAVLVRLLSRADIPPQADTSIAASDILAVIRGIVDGAGARNEIDLIDLHRRASRAACGYLQG